MTGPFTQRVAVSLPASRPPLLTSSVKLVFMEERERLILALDFPAAPIALDFLTHLQAALPFEVRLRWVKVGLELFITAGPDFLKELHKLGYQVFLDLKFHDIPNTVAGAVRSAVTLGPALLTVHASGGPAMLAAAAQAARGSQTKLLAVTVLTSMDAQELVAAGVVRSPSEQVLALARMAASAGFAGLVCSAQEAASLRVLLPGIHLVTPGIRPAGIATGDQQRTGTPAQALAGGADQLVIGRPITEAPDPASAYMAILTEMKSRA